MRLMLFYAALGWLAVARYALSAADQLIVRHDLNLCFRLDNEGMYITRYDDDENYDD